MARVAEEELERIKREVSIERLVEASGVKLSRHGADLIGLCPFHEDREPSLVVTPAKNLWHCLGACRTGGSVVDWVMKSQGLSFRHTVEVLRNNALPISTTVHPIKQSTVPKLPCPFEREAEDDELARRVVDFYHATLKAEIRGQKFGDRLLNHLISAMAFDSDPRAAEVGRGPGGGRAPGGSLGKNWVGPRLLL